MKYSSKTHEAFKSHIYRGEVVRFNELWSATEATADPWVMEAYKDGRYDEGRGLLNWAANRKGNLEILTAVLEKGCDINHQDGKLRTALSNAVDCDNIEMVRYLISKGANPMIQDYTGANCLHVAAHGASAEVIRLLLSVNAGLISDQDKNGSTPVHIAAKYSMDALHSILKIRPDIVESIINMPDGEGDTPLHWAAESEDICAPTYLMIMGASATIPNKSGKTPYLKAEEWESGGKSGRAILSFDRSKYTTAEEYYLSIRDDGASASISGKGTSSEVGDYWEVYTGAGLNEVLSLRLGSLDEEYKLTVSKSVFLASDTMSSVERIVTKLIQSSHEGLTFIPLNLYSKHWVGIAVNSHDDKVEIHYMDPENNKIPEGLLCAISDGFIKVLPGRELTIVQDEVEKQKYNNCGPEVIENFMEYLTGHRLPQEDSVSVHSMLYEDFLCLGVGVSEDIA